MVLRDWVKQGLLIIFFSQLTSSRKIIKLNENKSYNNNNKGRNLAEKKYFISNM